MKEELLIVRTAVLSQAWALPHAANITAADVLLSVEQFRDSCHQTQAAPPAAEEASQEESRPREPVAPGGGFMARTANGLAAVLAGLFGF